VASPCPQMTSDDQFGLARELYFRLAQLCWVVQSGGPGAGEGTGEGDPAERERIDALEEIVHLNRIMSLGQLAASLAHELAQPLAAIRANTRAAERLARLPKPDLSEIRAALADIAADDRRAETVVQNIRAVFQKRPIALQDLDLNQVVDDVAQLVRHNAELRSVRIRLLLSSQPVVVRGDQGVLQQILLNLVNNAMDAMSHLPTERRVLAFTTRVAAGRRCGRVLVEDKGSGIPEEDKARLFTPFFTTKSKGLGIGLSICRTLVEFLHGKIHLDNRTGPGTTFVVELPLAIEAVISQAA
jgi:C4-dicarboxylate-specific signal transduction histidine kinase